MGQNFLLGKGERLTESVVVKSGGGPKSPPYTFPEARERISPRLASTVKAIDELPPEACPDEQAVVSIVLNPEYIAKSYFPVDLLKAANLTPIGSRPRRIKPEKRSRDRVPMETTTTELFAVGSRSAIREWSNDLPNWTERSLGGKDLLSIEDISAPAIENKIKGELPDSGDSVFEVVLHADSLTGENLFLPKFETYLKSLGIEDGIKRKFYAGGLCFVEIDAPTNLAGRIATFSIVRAIREMPTLRTLRPTFRSSTIPSQSLQLPSEKAIDSSIKVAIFDGGLPDDHHLTSWAAPIDAPGVGAASDEFLQHGIGVTSALLFGHIDPHKPLPIPYANVDHYRVLDVDPGKDPHELYEILDRINAVLSSNKYDFVNLSLGPRLPIEDDEVHAWTAVLDDRFSRSDCLAVIAVGNDGEGDPDLKLNRIQVPSDCINALAVGACDSPGEDWERAAYSSVGPGRSPGFIKPDIVDFGGSVARPFLVIGDNQKPTLEPTGGTSFSAPSVLRLGTGIRAHFGSSLNLLSIRTLIVHCAETNDIPKEEIGWGRVARNLEEVVICEDNTVRVVYQGTVNPSKYIRASIPMPLGEIEGMVTIKATVCYSSKTDPHHPSSYTQTGLELAFRPHDQRFSRIEQLHPDTKSFFGTPRMGAMEDELRRDAWKWENCLHAERRLRGSSLLNPCFDIHHNCRLEGRNFVSPDPLEYALVISIQGKKMPNLYDQVVRNYATILEPLRPRIDIPIRT